MGLTGVGVWDIVGIKWGVVDKCGEKSAHLWKTPLFNKYAPLCSSENSRIP